MINTNNDLNNRESSAFNFEESIISFRKSNLIVIIKKNLKFPGH